jgi:ATP-dependent protease ClpP protease subunit
MNLLLSGDINDAMVRRVHAAIMQLDNVSVLNLYINSQGGDEHCGRAVAGLISVARKSGKKVDTIGVGDVQSAAVVIFAAGERRMLSKLAHVMVHESSAEVDGNASAIKAHAKQMERDEQFWCDILAVQTGTEAKVWMKLHEDETYLTPEECLKHNLATELI